MDLPYFSHEIAYVLGQLGNAKAIPILINLLENKSKHCMVRHEAAEALGALKVASPEVLNVLKAHCNDPSAPVRETCQLALQSLEARIQAGADAMTDKGTPTNFYLFNGSEGKPFATVDPVAKTDVRIRGLSTTKLAALVLDPDELMYNRYEALFALRDRNTEEAIAAVINGLLLDQSSALFRHEVAFVLGQIQSSKSLEALGRCLENTDEHPMARHEAALALGSVGAANGNNDCIAKAEKLLRDWAKDPDPIVAESCLVGLENIKEECHTN